MNTFILFLLIVASKIGSSDWGDLLGSDHRRFRDCSYLSLFYGMGLGVVFYITILPEPGWFDCILGFFGTLSVCFFLFESMDCRRNNFQIIPIWIIVLISLGVPIYLKDETVLWPTGVCWIIYLMVTLSLLSITRVELKRNFDYSYGEA